MTCNNKLCITFRNGLPQFQQMQFDKKQRVNCLHTIWYTGWAWGCHYRTFHSCSTAFRHVFHMPSTALPLVFFGSFIPHALAPFHTFATDLPGLYTTLPRTFSRPFTDLSFRRPSTVSYWPSMEVSRCFRRPFTDERHERLWKVRRKCLARPNHHLHGRNKMSNAPTEQDDRTMAT